MSTLTALQLFLPATLAFFIGVAMTPFLTHLLYKHRMWKPMGGKTAFDGQPAIVFNELHKAKEVGTPRFGGVIVWGSVLGTALLLQLLWALFPNTFESLEFISRGQTWVPLAALIVGALVGLVDDFYEVKGRQGVRLRTRLGVVALVALLCALWFYFKLEVHTISFPFMSTPVELGLLFIPFFVLVALFMYAGGVIDGIDGLAGGQFLSIFGAYATIAFFQHQYDIASLCAALVGGLLAFLWFNVPPARFYLSETGTMGLTLALTVIAFMTDSLGEGRGIAILPIIALPLVATVLSDIVQILGKKFLGRKILRIAPLHHHFEAIGWPSYKVTMRYWIIGIVCAIVGVAFGLV